MSTEARTIAELMRSGANWDDGVFDQLIPLEHRSVSAEYWTPLAVALRAAEWFEKIGARRIFDVGSGVGKFCVAGALAGDCTYTGVEHRGRLVTAARELTSLFDLQDRVEFVQGVFSSGNWPTADVYYFYNPFGENLVRREHQLDADVELSPARYDRDVAAVEQLIAYAPRDTYLLTFNGFGGRIPDSYDQVACDRDLPFELVLWRKVRQLNAGRVLRRG